MITLPDGVLGMAARGPEWAAWVERLGPTTDGLLAEWELTADGLPMHGYTSLVVPARTARDESVVLKVTFDGDEESRHEGLALQHWGGNGTVRLLRADPHRRALLLERLHGEDLTTAGDTEACEIVAALYARLHIPAPPQLATVTSYVAAWLTELAELPRDAALPRRFVEQALGLGRDLVTDPESTGRLVHGDLHHLNVLAADREPWLVIDPKPMSGDPHFEPAPMLWNRWDDIVSTGDVRAAVRRRFHTLVDAAGLDEERARDWVVVRLVLNAGWTVQDGIRAGRPRAEEGHAWITRCLSIAKAVQD